MKSLNPRTAIIIAVIGSLLGGGLIGNLYTTYSTAPDRAQLREFAELDRILAEVGRQDLRIEQQSTRITELRNDVRDLATLLATSRSEVTALKDRIAELEAQLLQRDEIIATLRDQITELRQELADLRKTTD